MTLNSKQAIANPIPIIARMSKITMSSSLKVFKIHIGVPSGGIPPVCVYYIQNKTIIIVQAYSITRIDVTVTKTRCKAEGIIV